jgi:hypothetical protein
MLAHADKRAAAPFIQDLFNNRAQLNTYFAEEEKEMSGRQRGRFI